MLLAGTSAELRDARIASVLAEIMDRPASVLIEGGLAGFDANALDVHVHQLGFGCPCCTGFLPLEVTLVRILRQERPRLIVLAALPGSHLEPLAAALASRFREHLLVQTRFS